MNKQLKMGIRVEREHRPTVQFIKQFLVRNRRLPTNREIYYHIAQNHIAENPKYYTRLKRAKL